MYSGLFEFDDTTCQLCGHAQITVAFTVCDGCRQVIDSFARMSGVLRVICALHGAPLNGA